MAKPGIYLRPALLDSEAFFSLKTWDFKLLFEIYRRRQIKKQSGKNRWKQAEVILNNGKVVFTYSDGLNYGFDERKFRDALDTLIERGFLEITHQGTGTGDPTLYYVSNRWVKWGTPDFEPVPSERQRRKRVSTDSGWSAYNKKKRKSPVKNDSGTTGNIARRSRLKKWIDV